jgi:hypothetical protein
MEDFKFLIPIIAGLAVVFAIGTTAVLGVSWLFLHPLAVLVVGLLLGWAIRKAIEMRRV